MGTHTPRRQFRRYDVDDLPGSLAFATEVEVLNLSLAGMAVETRAPLEVGKRFGVRIGRSPDSLILRAVVRWCQAVDSAAGTEGQEETVYHGGFAFEDILTEKAHELLGFMERNVVLALDHQLFGRLDLGGDAAVTLETNYQFVVKRLSGSGMLMETTFPAHPGQVYDLELNLGGERFSSHGRIVDVLAAERRAASLVGVEFVDPSPEERRRLLSYLRSELQISLTD